ncbi:MAG: O-antigen ligase family protein [Lachnospiraceae bacterium]|nr:O-antigen ligase family protein [Lachnospiraceae bacterium]
MAAKLKKQEKKRENPGKETMTIFLQYVTVLLTCLIVTILPLALKDGYYQIGDFKFKVYQYIMTGGMVVIGLLLVLYAIFALKDTEWKKLPSSCSVTDYFVIAYLLLTLISYLINAEYRSENLMGYPGWYMGLFAQLTFGFLYFVVSRFGKDYKITLALFAAAALLTYIFAILHRMLIDPLHTYDGIDPYYYNFLSTLGQSSWYSGFLCSFLPFAMGLYMVSKNRTLHILSGIFTMTGFISLVSQNSDSAYFAMAGTFMLLLFIAVREAIWIRRLCELAFGIFAGGKIMRLLLVISPNEYLFTGEQTKLDQISYFIIFDQKSWIMVVLLALLWIPFFMMEKKNTYKERPLRIIRNVIYGLFLICVLAAAMILYLGAKGKFSEQTLYAFSKMPYLVWHNAWGNGRGFTWSMTWTMIREFSPLKLLLGVGPDGYANYGLACYGETIRAAWGNNVLTNAHNEWLNMIINGGLMGGAAYLGIFLSSMIRYVKNSRQEAFTIAFAACIASYVFHNVFCYQEVLCTPFLFLLMGIGEYCLREQRKTES